MKKKFLIKNMDKTNIEFLSDLTRTYTTFIVGATAMAYYVSGILINSAWYVIYVELIYIVVWLIMMNLAKKIRKEEIS